MNQGQQEALRSWAKFLNPEVLRGNLIASSIFLAAFETLRTTVIGRIKDFFTHGFDENGWIVSQDYGKKVLALDKSPFRASLLWLESMAAIDQADIDSMNLIREHRNELAHDLPKFIATSLSEVNTELLVRIYELVSKIDRWWIREVDLATDPDHDGSQIDDKDITSGSMLFIQMMMHVATRQDSAIFWQEFQKQAGMVFDSDVSQCRPSQAFESDCN